MLERFLSAILGVPRIAGYEVLGIPVVVENTRPDVTTADVIARLERCLLLIQQNVPHHFWHLQRDFDHIIVKRFACRGAEGDEARRPGTDSLPEGQCDFRRRLLDQLQRPICRAARQGEGELRTFR